MTSSAGFSVRFYYSALRAGKSFYDVFPRRQEIEEADLAEPGLWKKEGDNNKVTTNETKMKVVIEAGGDCHMPYNSIRLFDSIQQGPKLLFIDPLGSSQSLSFVPVISVEESRIFSLILGDIGPQIGL